MRITRCIGHNRCHEMLVRILNISIPIIAIYLLIQVQAIPQQQQPAPQEQVLQAKANTHQKELNIGAPISTPNQTADLSLLINETLAINNKTLSTSDKTIVKDDWTFDMIEYDLMEFLQDLSARYKQNNKTSDGTTSSFSSEDSLLNAKSDESPIAAAPDSIAKTTSLVDASVLLRLPVNEPQLQPNAAAASLPPASRPKIAHPTSIPLLSTSLASGDPEIAESSWQYGIFDRFTRPKSTTRSPTTPSSDSMYDSAEVSKLDVRNFNSDECGLRTYAEERETHFAYPPDQLDVPDEIQIHASKRQRLPLGIGERRKLPSSILIPIIKDRGDIDANSGLVSDSEGTMQKPPSSSSMLDQWEGAGSPLLDEGTDSGKSEGMLSLFNDNQTSPTASADSLAESEFNLASRRQWLQQQLGNTLQILGFNMTTNNQTVSDLFVNQSGGGLGGSNIRENMMKMSGKWGKTADIDKLSNSQSPEQKLLARQDDLKLEARVIGGSDARLGDSPWSVSLQALVSRPGTGSVEYRHYCGGTIISEYYVLTAAHCLDFMVGRESRLFVVVGDINWRMSTSSLHGRRFGIEKLIIHSGYKSTAFGHDIGLIRTKESMKPLKINGKYIVNSVCLPSRGVEHSGEAELVGWGLFSNRNEMADSLQIADVPVLPRPLCVDLYKRRTGLIQWLIGIELITDKQVCAGTFGRGICQGDSGSALVVNEKVYAQQASSKAKGLRDRDTRQTKATIIGIVAFGGIRRCSYQSLPGVYMQTSKYMDWIMPRIQN